MRSAAVQSPDANSSQIPFDLKTQKMDPGWVQYPRVGLQEDQRGSHLSLGYQMDELRDQEDLTSVQYRMTWDRLAMYVDGNA